MNGHLDGIQNTDHALVMEKVEEYATHLTRLAEVFTMHAQELGLGVKLDASGAIAAVKNGTGLSRVMRFCDRQDDTGVLHDAQLMTALDCVGELLTAPQKNGLILGAMQSGKTTTSLAMQFAGPIVYLLTGRCLYPIYLITSHTSQEDQTKMEIARFLDFYGELSVVLDDEHQCTLIEYVQNSVNPIFQFAPTINTYREQVLEKALPDTMVGPRLDDFIQRRAPGESIRNIARLCRRANEHGFAPLLIIDEPQFGASDRFVKRDGDFERRSCILLQIFDQIDEVLGEDAADRVFIGLSATPFELHDIKAVWEVKQYLSSTYTGFNYFGGEVIDVHADVDPPRTITFSQLGLEINQPFLSDVSLVAYDAEASRFDRFARKTGFTGTQREYRNLLEQTLRECILHLAERSEKPGAGVCIRLFNNNSRSHQLISNLDLPEDRIEVIEYFGSERKGQSVKRAIRQRNHPELPFLVAVTNRARMGDAFPGEVEWFLEFTNKAANLNALLQGLLGRACGYSKNSTVVMSPENVQLVEDYTREEGGYIYKTSPHSVVSGQFRRGAPTSLIRLRRDMNDPLVKEFFRRLDEELVQPHIIQDSPNLRTGRAKGKRRFRAGPLLKIAEDLALFDHIEKETIRAKLFPTYPGFTIARAGDVIDHTRSPDRKLSYTLDDDGNCRFTFREWTEGSASHGGVRSRGYGARDAKDHKAAGDTLEPQVNMRKFDPVTGEAIDDKRINGNLARKHERKSGSWRAEMVTLPLVNPVRELQSGEATYPVEHSPFADLMNSEERTSVGYMQK